MRNLLNKTAVREHILKRFAEKRGCNPKTRVSSRAMEQLEFALLRLIDREIMKHPSQGVTFDIPVGSCGEAKCHDES